MRYLRGFDIQNRDEYHNAAWSYLFNNPFGGTFEFSAAGNGLPHNFFLNALLCGGILGGIILIWLLIIQIKKIWPYILPTSKFSNAEGAFVWGLLYIDYTLNSMLHNISIASGAFLFFVWWAAFLALASIDTVPLKRYRRKMVL
jgi:O-antigen ligase